MGLDPHGGDAAHDRDVTYDRDRAYDDGPLLDSDRDGRGPIEEVLDGPDDLANPRVAIRRSHMGKPRRAPFLCSAGLRAQGTRCVQASVRNLVSISSRAASSSARSV